MPNLVTNNNDSGPGSLRQVIAQAAPQSTVSFAPQVTGIITLTSGQLTITKSLGINGPGAGLLVISGNNASRVISVTAGVSATISGLTISGGHPAGGENGGGLYNRGTITLVSSSVAGNTAGQGGGIYNLGGTVTIVSSAIFGNLSNGTFAAGSGIYSTGTLDILDSAISQNTSSGSFSSVSGGLHNEGGILLLTQSVVISNTSLTAGGIYNSGSAIITDAVVTGNAGGGIRNQRTLTIANTGIQGNNGSDGGISNGGTLTITTSSIQSNVTSSFAGGLTNSGEAHIDQTAIISNTGSSGGGIFNYYTGHLSLINSTVSGNAGSSGGGLYMWGPAFGMTGTATLNNVTMSNNQGGGISNVDSATVYASNTIVAGNSGSDCAGPIVSGGYNLVQNDSGCTITGTTTGNIIGIGPSLGPLANNGGPTLTHALLILSPARNNGNPTSPGSGGDACEATDQRGVTRPQETFCDIGAYER